MGDIDIEKLYELFNNKDKSFYHFMKFFEYMIEQQKYNIKDKQLKEDYEYHFYRLPKYLKDVFQKVKYETMRDITSINMVADRLSKKINELSKGEE